MTGQDITPWFRRTTRDMPHPSCRVTHPAMYVLGAACVIGMLFQGREMVLYTVCALVFGAVVSPWLYKGLMARPGSPDEGPVALERTAWAPVAMLMDLLMLAATCRVLWIALFEGPTTMLSIASGEFWIRAAVIVPGVLFWLLAHRLAAHPAAHRHAPAAGHA